MGALALRQHRLAGSGYAVYLGRRLTRLDASHIMKSDPGIDYYGTLRLSMIDAPNPAPQT